MGYNPHEHVCEWFDFECVCKNNRNAICEQILTTSGYRNNIDYYMAFFISYPLSAQGMIYEWGLIKGMIWKMTCYDMFIIYFNRGNNLFVPKWLVIFG